MTQALAPQCYAYNIKTVMTILFKNVWYGPFRTKLEPFLANFEPYEKELHQHHFQRMVLYLSHKLRCYTGISGPEKSRNNTREKMSYFSFLFFFFLFFFFTCVDIANQLLGFQQWALGMTDVTTCRRTTSECKRSCPFKKSNLPCTKACLCMADEGCCNPLNEELLSDNDSSASDTEWLLLLLMSVCKFHVLIRSLPLGTDAFPLRFWLLVVSFPIEIRTTS